MRPSMRTLLRSSRRGARPTALLAAAAVMVAACGSAESTRTIEQAATERSQAQETTGESAGDAAPAGSESGADASVDESANNGAEAEQVGPALPIDHLFPDLETVRVTDGATINLADELAGGDTPILLWFYAPH